VEVGSITLWNGDDADMFISQKLCFCSSIVYLQNHLIPTRVLFLIIIYNNRYAASLNDPNILFLKYEDMIKDPKVLKSHFIYFLSLSKQQQQ
jgi:hypothetical protein